MNVYLLFALAFGAVTGVAEVRIARVSPVPVSISVRAAKTGSFAVRRAPFAVAEARNIGERRTANSERKQVSTVLTGASTPRAPAQNC